MSWIPQNQMVMLVGDMNGHAGSSNVGYDGTQGGFWYGDRMQMDPGSWSLQTG